MWILTKVALFAAINLFIFQVTTQSKGTKPDEPAAGSAAVAAAQPVITVHGVCPQTEGKTAPNANSCSTVITREQFENLVQALHPGQGLPAPARNNLAKLYAEYLTIEAATHQAGMDDTAEFHEFMNWMRALAATEYYRRKLQQKYSSPSQQEIDAYYQQHVVDYEMAKVARVLIPRENPGVVSKDEFDKRALEAANAAHASLVKGLDPAEVQKSTYATLGLQAPPLVDLGNRRRKDFIDVEATEVFSLKPGAVTNVQTETKNYVIYKVLSKETTPEESLKKTISGQLTETRFRETMKSLVDSATVDLNEQYFGAPGPAPTEPPRSPHTITSH